MPVAAFASLVLHRATWVRGRGGVAEAEGGGLELTDSGRPMLFTVAEGRAERRQSGDRSELPASRPVDMDVDAFLGGGVGGGGGVVTMPRGRRPTAKVTLRASRPPPLCQRQACLQQCGSHSLMLARSTQTYVDTYTKAWTTSGDYSRRSSWKKWTHEVKRLRGRGRTPCLTHAVSF